MDINKLGRSIRKRIRTFYNFFIDLKKQGQFAPTDLKELNEITERSLKRTVINEHLVTLFIEAISIKPKLIVELGVGGGESTFVLARVAKLCGAKLVSLDIHDRSHVCAYEDWIFVQKDDLEFAQEFESWCAQKGIVPKIDILFVDTSHLFQHTLEEINSYFPFLSDNSKAFFHDTNLREIFFRKDGSMDLGWDNERGVIRALEEYFQKSFNEKEPFIAYCHDWLIKHHPYCCGLTILEKISFPV